MKDFGIRKVTIKTTDAGTVTESKTTVDYDKDAEVWFVKESTIPVVSQFEK